MTPVAASYIGRPPGISDDVPETWVATTERCAGCHLPVEPTNPRYQPHLAHPYSRHDRRALSLQHGCPFFVADFRP